MTGGVAQGRRLVWLVAVAAIAACSGEMGRSKPGSGSGDPGGAGGPSAGSGGSSAPPAPGTSNPPATPPAGTGGSSGYGGSTGTGGSSSGSGGAAGGSSGSVDAGASADAAGDASAPPPCAISLTPVSPRRWRDLPAGEGYKLRVEARATGSMVPAKPNWRWHIMHGGREVPTTVHDGDPAVRELVTDLPGNYDITVEILDTFPACRGSERATAILATQRVASFRIRARPPAQLADKLAPLEQPVAISAGTPITGMTTRLSAARTILVAPQDENRGALRSYFVRIAPRGSADRFEGYVDSTGGNMFKALVDIGRDEERYDVMIVPDSPVAMVIPPAQRFTGLSASDFFPASDFRVDSGIPVGGSVSVGARPLVGAKVRLRAGLLPSTVGVTDAGGSFGLRARNGRFEVRVVPPSSNGLPEGLPDALLPESSGLEIRAGAPPQISLRYAEVPPALLNLRVLTPDGAVPPGAVELILETVDGALPDVGVFTLPGGVTATAQGSVRLIRKTSAGLVQVPKLPRARYRATLIPPEDLAGAAITTVEFAADGAVVNQTITLSRRSRILGRLLPPERSRDLTVRALDVGADGVRRAVTAVVDAEGRYQLSVDPDRVYRLFVEPAPARQMPRVPLTAVRSRAIDVNDEQRLPPGLAVKGNAQDTGGSTLAGAVIQIFCVGAAPDCIASDSPDISNTPPIDETVTAADGSYLLHVPDPGL